jgi:hypothetical protein
MFPLVAVAGTVAVNCVELTIVNVATTPLNLTDVNAVKFDPLIVTTVPAGPFDGVNELTTGVDVTTGVIEFDVAVLDVTHVKLTLLLHMLLHLFQR